MTERYHMEKLLPFVTEWYPKMEWFLATEWQLMIERYPALSDSAL